jgi:uncharacterized protein YdaU (DUF1376 family)
MPLYIADYRADTAHLSAAQHGAYLLLIMHYWQTGGLPLEDAALARIACMSPVEWKRNRAAVAAFFTSRWTHKRIDKELAKSAEISSKRSASAKQKHSNSSANAPANVQQLDTHAGATSQPQSPKEDRIGEARASSFTEGSKKLSDAFWKALGFESALQIPPEFAGVDWRAISWEIAGWTADLIDAETRRIGPDKPLNYYEKVFATAFAKRQTPLPVVEIREAEKLTVKVHGTTQNQSVVAAARRFAEQFESQSCDGIEGNSDALLRLSQG